MNNIIYLFIFKYIFFFFFDPNISMYYEHLIIIK